MASASRGRARKPRPAVMTPEDFRKLLKAAGLTTRQAGEKLGISHATVSRWQTGGIPIGTSAAILIGAVIRGRAK